MTAIPFYKNPFFAATITLGALAFTAILFIDNKSSNNAILSKKLISLEQEHHSLLTKKPTNLDLAKHEEFQENIQGTVKTWKTFLDSEPSPQNPTELNFSINELAQTFQKLADEQNVKISPSCHFGFKAFLNTQEIPKVSELETIHKQKIILNYLINTLFNTNPKQLFSVEISNPLHFELVFSGKTHSLRHFINQINQSNLPFVIRNIEVSPQAHKKKQKNTKKLVNTKPPQFKVNLEFLDFENPNIQTKKPQLTINEKVTQWNTPETKDWHFDLLDCPNLFECPQSHNLLFDLKSSNVKSTPSTWALLKLTPQPYRIQLDGLLSDKSGETVYLLSSTNPQGSFKAKLLELIDNQQIKIISGHINPESKPELSIYDYQLGEEIHLTSKTLYTENWDATLTEHKNPNIRLKVKINQGQKDLSIGDQMFTISKINHKGITLLNKKTNLAHELLIQTKQ